MIRFNLALTTSILLYKKKRSTWRSLVYKYVKRVVSFYFIFITLLNNDDDRNNDNDTF